MIIGEVRCQHLIMREEERDDSSSSSITIVMENIYTTKTPASSHGEHIYYKNPSTLSFFRSTHSFAFIQ